MKESLGWVPHVLAVELKKALSYRAAFWIGFLGQILTELAVAYFLWDALFEQEGARALGGYSFQGILYYYVFASLSSKVIQASSQGAISQEIYDGSLTRYLVYPLSYLGYRFVSTFARQVIGFLQLVACFGIALLLLGPPRDLAISPASLALGSLTILLAGAVYFMLVASLEMVAFWQDTVWNLLAMLRFIGGLVGGLLVPLSLFPDWGRRAAELTPFPYLYSFPIRTCLGQVSAGEWFAAAAILLLWGCMTTALALWVWSRGTRRYTGVGI